MVNASDFGTTGAGFENTDPKVKGLDKNILKQLNIDQTNQNSNRNMRSQRNLAAIEAAAANAASAVIGTNSKNTDPTEFH